MTEEGSEVNWWRSGFFCQFWFNIQDSLPLRAEIGRILTHRNVLIVLIISETLQRISMRFYLGMESGAMTKESDFDGGPVQIRIQGSLSS